MNLKIKGYYQFDQNLKDKDLKYTDISFIKSKSLFSSYTFITVEIIVKTKII